MSIQELSSENGIASTSARQKEDEPTRIRDRFQQMPQPLQNVGRGIAEKVPALKDIALGNPHTPVVGVVERIRDAIRPPQS